MAASAEVIPLCSPAQPIPTCRPVAQTQPTRVLALRREIDILAAQAEAAGNEVRATLAAGFSLRMAYSKSSALARRARAEDKVAYLRRLLRFGG